MNAQKCACGAVLALLAAFSPSPAAAASEEACKVLEAQTRVYAVMVASFEAELATAENTDRQTLSNIGKQTGSINRTAMQILRPLNALDNVNGRLNAIAGAKAALGC